MTRITRYFDGRRSAAITIIALVALSAPSAAFANRKGGSNFDSTVSYWGCIFGGGNPAYCKQMAAVEDPPSSGVTSLTLSIQYDPSVFTFDQAESGPLGVYAVGGDSPPVAPGVGTEAFQSLPSGGITPGAPLPGSTLTYTNVAGLLTVDYELASPVTASGDVNDFILMFDLVNPVHIDFAASTVTYDATGPGTDFTKTNFSCTTTVEGQGCGSDEPTSGISINFSKAPEPMTLSLFGAGIMGAVAMRRRRKMAA